MQTHKETFVIEVESEHHTKHNKFESDFEVMAHFKFYIEKMFEIRGLRLKVKLVEKKRKV